MEKTTIKKTPSSDRPRERLINIGRENLSDEELLSILLNSGSKEMSVKTLSSLILSKAGGLKKLSDETLESLTKIKGIGTAKACVILSLIELSKRMNRKVSILNGLKLNTSQIVFDYYKSKIDKDQERFYAIYLDAKKRVIKEKLLFIGTVNHSMVHPRDIFKEAYKLNASYLICVHNHPSGDVNPSLDDIKVTQRIMQIGNLMGIKLIDHLVVSENKYYSFLENNKI